MMKSVTDNEKRDTEFYLCHVAPLNHHRDTPFRYLDMALLTVLFLEIGGLIRFVLAN
jgi:hypothetical protein